MAEIDLSSELRALRSTLSDINQVIDVPKLVADIRVLEEQAAEPGLWDNPEIAQKITSALSHKQAMVKKVEDA